jgi:hypothetical protein
MIEETQLKMFSRRNVTMLNETIQVSEKEP